jgi:FdhD protein
MREVEIVKIDVSTRTARKVKDYVAEEKPLNIFLNKAYYATIFCSPSNLKELAIGHLLSEGILKSFEEIEEVDLKDEACHVKIKFHIDIKKRLKLSKHFSRIITSACGSSWAYSGKIPKIKSDLKVKAETILNSVRNLNFIAETFRKTGGVHVAAIYKADGTLVAFAEDVGRHNAVDKAIGMAALNKTDFGACFLELSGRLTGDMVLKAGRVGLPIVASLAAALDSGIAIAKDIGLTLIGFVRGNRMNIYACPERILLN